MWFNGEIIFDRVNEQVKRESKVVNTNLVENKVLFSQQLGYFLIHLKIKRLIACIFRVYFKSKNKTNKNKRKELTSEELEKIENYLKWYRKRESQINWINLKKFKMLRIKTEFWN